MKQISLTKNYLLKSHKKSNHATYLRGLAALGVMLSHYGGLGLSGLFSQGSTLDQAATKFVVLGGQGPTVFFISSGYVLYESFKRIPKFRQFLVIRYFRLMPLYLIISIFAAIVQNQSTDYFTFLLKLFFLDIVFESAYSFSPINIAFFIVIEFWLSLTLALTVLIPRRLNGRIVNLYYILLVLFSFSVHFATGYFADLLADNRFHYEILRFQFWFILGSVLKAYSSKLNYSGLWNLFVFGLILVAFVSEFYLGYFVGIASVFFLISEKGSSTLLPLVVVGNICYSIYLLHQPLLYFFTQRFEFTPWLICLICLVVSVFTFRFIEIPFIKMGKKIANKV
jgi:exopolysaccharide production protein ExoZ